MLLRKPAPDSRSRTVPPLYAPCGIAVLLAAQALTGCTPKTDVSLTADVPAQYAHVFVTFQQVWFNTDPNAGPDESGWQKFTLASPDTVDLFSAAEGTLTQLTTGLKVSAGTYNQLRLIPVDAGASLTASAQSAGAIYNFEVDYVDGANATHQVPLELQNPDKGIGIATSLTIGSGVKASFVSGTNTTATNSTQNTTGFFTPSSTTTTGTTTINNGTTTNPLANNTTNTSTTTTPVASPTLAPVSLTVDIDTARDLEAFNYGGSANTVTAYLLNPHLTAYALTGAGAVQGTVAVSGLSGITTTNNHLPIQVTAEKLSSDGTRHIVVNSTAVTSSGSFVLYPLPAPSSGTTNYDLVIHGAGITTIIIKSVPVRAGNPATSTPVSIGTVAPRAADSFAVNLDTTTPLPAGALVDFSQTLPVSGDVPYVIEERPIDPFSRSFAADQALSAGALDFGTFVSGSAVALSATNPTEGVATYRVSAIAPLFTAGALSTTVATPPGGTTTALKVALPALTVAQGATSDSISFSITETTPGKYDKGELIVSKDGAIVATASLDTILGAQDGTGTVAVSGLPGGSSSSSYAPAIYYVSVRTWNSASPTATLDRETYPNAADLRQGSLSGYALNVD